jgi:hypothetical protein
MTDSGIGSQHLLAFKVDSHFLGGEVLREESVSTDYVSEALAQLLTLS